MKTETEKCIKSHSLLQDQFYEDMQAAGYQDIQRDQKGNTEWE